MIPFLAERFRIWKWAILLASTITLLPGIVAPLFAQNGRGSEAALRTGCPLLCCNDVQTPDIGPGGALTLLGVIAFAIILLATVQHFDEKRIKKEQQQREHEEQAKQQAIAKKQAEDALKYPQLKGKKVRLPDFNNQPTQGIVVSQYEDQLTIHFLSDDGQLEMTKKKIEEVQVINPETNTNEK